MYQLSLITVGENAGNLGKDFSFRVLMQPVAVVVLGIGVRLNRIGVDGPSCEQMSGASLVFMLYLWSPHTSMILPSLQNIQIEIAGGLFLDRNFYGTCLAIGTLCFFK